MSEFPGLALTNGTLHLGRALRFFDEPPSAAAKAESPFVSDFSLASSAAPQPLGSVTLFLFFSITATAAAQLVVS